MYALIVSLVYIKLVAYLVVVVDGDDLKLEMPLLDIIYIYIHIHIIYLLLRCRFFSYAKYFYP